MAITKLSTTYQDDILDTSVNTKRRYQMTSVEGETDTYEFEDKSTYAQVGTDFKASDINTTNATVNQLIDIAEPTQTSINGLISGSVTASKAKYADSVGSVDNDFILINQAELTFSSNVCTISDSRITANSLADVYYTADTSDIAVASSITVETNAGSVVLTAGTTPTATIKATIRIRVIE